MRQPEHDDERLAALLDGRLQGPEREALLAYLAAADEDFEVFAATAAILLAAEEQDAREAYSPHREMQPPSTRRYQRGWRRTPRWTRPAILSGLMVLGIFALRSNATPPDPARMAAHLEEIRALPWDSAGRPPDALVRRAQDWARAAQHPALTAAAAYAR